MPSLLSNAIKSVYRASQRRRLSRLVSWSPLPEPEPGYTVILAASRRLLPLALANLGMVGRQRAPGCSAVLVVVDAVEHELPAGFADACRAALSRGTGAGTGGSATGLGDKLRVLTYSTEQAATARAIEWGWVYSWLSWSLGIGACRTKHALLHDLDAMALDPGFFEERYSTTLREGASWLGLDPYSGLGVPPDREPTRTFEMVFDVAQVRGRFEPVDLFNRMDTIAGKRVELDTTIWAQIQTGGARSVAVPEEWVVHPSQMICQHVDLLGGRRRVPPANSLPLLPYFLMLGGDASLFDDVLGQMRAAGFGGLLSFLGRTLDLAAIPPEHAAWLEKQGLRVESAVTGGRARAEVTEYFARVRTPAGLSSAPARGASGSVR